MSSEVTVTAILNVKPEKIDKHHIHLTTSHTKSFLAESLDHIRANEPYILSFRVLEVPPSEDGKRQIILWERYENQAALEKHWSSLKYQEMMSEMQAEDLLVEGPMILQANVLDEVMRD
ncbi:uncharacterized protein LTR77_009658 [Saxophila tyrrhenica]|uniref:ABM domain-containing protein n=1 Tax=Saxophila tyrrhenica TaxID=1690608 RepID=A0AAV9P0B2_9PEZI|nr:hypothetical protein LTR77_009658 [Saxophila tyrrhenica]